MEPRCETCTHPERAAIDQALVAGQAGRAVADRYGLSEASVRRHKDAHLPSALMKAEDAAEASRADELLRQVRALQGKTLQTLLAAEKQGDLGIVLRAVREARENLELLAKLQGQLAAQPTVNIILSPEWVDLRTQILVALSPYPDARGAVVEALNGAG